MMRRYGNYRGGYGNDYDREDYEADMYGRRVPGYGRGRGYGRRGVPGTGHRYSGEEMLEETIERYQDYSEGKEEAMNGNYGAQQDSMKALDYMLKSVVQFIEMLKKDASSQEEIDLIQKYSRQISEM